MKIVRASTVPQSLNTFCRGLLHELSEEEGYDILAVASPGDALDEVAEREGVRAVAVSMQRHISPFKDLRSLWKLYRLFRREHPDMVHSMTPKAGLLCMMAARMAGVPIRVHTFTGLVFPTSSGMKRRILIMTDRMTCRCATHIIPEGEGVKNDLENFKITKKPLRVLGYGNIKGIDLHHFDPSLPEVQTQAIKLRDKDVFTFIYIGRLVGDKGINELISAFTRLSSEMEVRLLLVGKSESELDPLKPETESEIANNPNIHAVGQQSDVRPWLAASDALVFPSYREGFPNVVIEAGAMGLPSIVTDINGSREIIKNGENGIIVPPRDSDALYLAMKRIITDVNSRQYIASNARSMIVNRFEQSFVRKCLKDFYRQVIAEKIK